MTQPADGVYSRVIHGICVLCGITHATPYVIRVLHFWNLLSRMALLCTGIVSFSTNTHLCVSGLVISPYNSSSWGTLKHTDWVQGTLPSMQSVAGPGNIVVVALWFTCVICFVVNDGLRCALVYRGTWFTHENHMDMSWSTLTCTAIPLLFACGAVQLGTRDVFVLGTVVFITLVSGLCGAITEHLRTLVNPYAIEGFSDNVLWILRVTQDLTLIIAAQLVTIPFVMNSMDLDHHMSTYDIVTSLLFTGLTYALTITCYRHHRLCSIFEQTWPTRCSMSPWGSNTVVVENAAVPRLQSTDEHFYPSPYAVTPLPFNGKKPSKPIPFNGKPSKSVGPINVVSTCETPEETFNKLYGCHLWHSDSADIVHIVDQDHRVVTVQLTEDFNMYNQLHEPVSIARCGVLANGLHIANLGAAPQIFHTHIDEDGTNTRMMIGLLTEWRRYYIVNIFIDAVLLSSLLDMTNMGDCSI